jgi:hypothetical protein
MEARPRRGCAGGSGGPVPVDVPGAGFGDHDLVRGRIGVESAERANRRVRHRPVPGQLGPAAHLGAGVAERVQVHARGSLHDLLAAAPVEVGDGRAGEELEIVDRLREVGSQLTPAADAPGAEEILPSRLVVGERDVQRPAEPGGGRDEAQAGSVEVREGRGANRRDERMIRLGAVAVGLQRDVGAARLPVAGLAVRIEDVGEAVVGHRADLRPVAASAADVADHRVAGDPLTHHREELGVDDRRLRRPPRQERSAGVIVAVGLDRVQAGVRGLERDVREVVAKGVAAPRVALALELVDPLADLIEQVERGAVRGRRVPPAVGCRGVLLVRPHDDLGRAVAVQVADRGRVHHRALHVGAGVGFEGHLVRLRIDRLHLARVDHQHGETGHRVAVAVPRI